MTFLFSPQKEHRCYLFVRRFICRGYIGMSEGANLRGRGRALDRTRSVLSFALLPKAKPNAASPHLQGSPPAPRKPLPQLRVTSIIRTRHPTLTNTHKKTRSQNATPSLFKLVYLYFLTLFKSATETALPATKHTAASITP